MCVYLLFITSHSVSDICVRAVGNPAFMRDESKELTLRVHDECTFFLPFYPSCYSIIATPTLVYEQASHAILRRGPYLHLLPSTVPYSVEFNMIPLSCLYFALHCLSIHSRTLLKSRQRVRCVWIRYLHVQTVPHVRDRGVYPRGAEWCVLWFMYFHFFLSC
jgi:hypothetical protein